MSPFQSVILSSLRTSLTKKQVGVCNISIQCKYVLFQGCHNGIFQNNLGNRWTPIHSQSLHYNIKCTNVLFQNIPDNETGSCSFWDFEGKMWSTQGCSVLYINSSHTSCHCNHLTNFAVLVSRSPVVS